MNFYNPYMYSLPVETGTSSLIKKISLSSIINGTSKTLNLINQAIPVVKQVSPIMKNMKTMFSVMNEFKKNDVTNTSIEDMKTNEQTTDIVKTTDEPKFFI